MGIIAYVDPTIAYLCGKFFRTPYQLILLLEACLHIIIRCGCLVSTRSLYFFIMYMDPIRGITHYVWTTYCTSSHIIVL